MRSDPHPPPSPGGRGSQVAVALGPGEACMDEQTLRELIGHVKAGRLSRRTFVQTMLSLGLTGPLAIQLLAPGTSRAQPRAAGFTPTRRGGGGLVRLLYWAAPTSL